MEYTRKMDGDGCIIVMKGKFTFSDHDNFRSIINLIKQKSSSAIGFDLEGVEFIDSAALGLLLIAREEAEKQGVSVTLIRPQGQLQKMLKVSNFYELFNVQE